MPPPGLMRVRRLTKEHQLERQHSEYAEYLLHGRILLTSPILWLSDADYSAQTMHTFQCCCFFP